MEKIVHIHRDLIEAAKKGGRYAQKSLFELYRRALFNIGVRILGNTDDAADVTQEVFIDIFKKLDSFGYKSTFGAWAKKGNGNFSFIDNIMEAKKVLVTEMGSTLQTIAKDVKIQLEFNAASVKSYRLIGYENRMLENEDFDNDVIDAGELGAGHTVTAVYEIVPLKGEKASTKTSKRKGVGAIENMMIEQTNLQLEPSDLAVLKFRYKHPDESKSQLIQSKITNMNQAASTDMIFISSVVEFGLLLRNSQFKGTANYDRILRNARNGLGLDPYGYRNEYISIVKQSKILSERLDTQ